MVSSIFVASLVAALAPQALADLFLTAPVASTSCAAGAPCNVAWNDNGNAPSLSDIGACNVGLYVGSQNTQILLQPLGSVDVSQQATASFTPDATVGGNSDLYFIRFDSVNLKDGQFPHQAFTAKFTLTGMTGTFNATEQSLMSAPTTPIGSSTGAVSTTQSGSSAPSSSSGLATSTVSGAPTTTPKPSGTTASHSGSSTPTSSKGGAAPALGSSSHAIALAAVVASAFFAAAAF